MEWSDFYEFYAPAADKGVDGILSTLEKYPNAKSIILIGKVGDTVKVTYFNRPSEWKVFLPHQRRSVVDGYFRFLDVNPDELHVFSLSKDRVEDAYIYGYIDFFQTALKRTGYTLTDESYNELEGTKVTSLLLDSLPLCGVGCFLWIREVLPTACVKCK